jgi:hypothetical protein
MAASKKAARDNFATALSEFDSAMARFTHCQPGMAGECAAALEIAQQRLEAAEAAYEAAA